MGEHFEHNLILCISLEISLYHFPDAPWKFENMEHLIKERHKKVYEKQTETAPSSRRRSTRCEPMKPHPPVTYSAVHTKRTSTRVGRVTFNFWALCQILVNKCCGSSTARRSLYAKLLNSTWQTDHVRGATAVEKWSRCMNDALKLPNETGRFHNRYIRHFLEALWTTM